MGKIFCLMGKSSSGKDTIFKALREDRELNLIPVIPYTTRPIRCKETDGIEYHFINEQKLSDFDRLGKIIEKRAYNTINGIWHYCTIDDGQIDLENGNYILIVTLEAYVELKKYYGISNVIPFYILVEDGIRLERALAREKQQKTPNYDEMCRRFLADNNDFCEEKLIEAGIKKHYNNYYLNECFTNIKNEILCWV